MCIGEIGELYAGPVVVSAMIPASRPLPLPKKIKDDEGQQEIPPVKGITETTFMVDPNSRKRGYKPNRRHEELVEEGQNVDLRA